MQHPGPGNEEGRLLAPASILPDLACVTSGKPLDLSEPCFHQDCEVDRGYSNRWLVDAREGRRQ